MTAGDPNTSVTSRLLGALHRLEDGILVFLLGSMIVLSFAQIALRNLFSINLLWAEPLIRHLVLWSGFLGALIATRQHSHIRIDALLRICSPGLRSLLLLFANLFSAAVCLVLTWVAVHFINDERAFDTGTLFRLSTWQWQLIFPITFGVMSLRFLGQCIRQAMSAIRERSA